MNFIRQIKFIVKSVTNAYPRINSYYIIIFYLYIKFSLKKSNSNKSSFMYYINTTIKKDA